LAAYGLLQRAIDLKRKKRTELSLVRTNEQDDEDALQISPEDRDAIYTQIEEIVRADRVKIDEDTFRFTPLKKAAVLPVVVNIVALFVVLISIGGALWYFQTREANITGDRVALASAEGMLLESLRRESEEQLQEKNQEILSIQNRLSDAVSARAEMVNDLSRQLAEREAQLLSDYEQRLVDERAAYVSQGLSEEEVEQRINEYSANAQTEYRQELDQVQSQIAEERLRQQETLDSLVGFYQGELQSAESNRNALQEQFESREQDILQQSAVREAELETEIEQATESLDTLRQQQEQEQLVSANISAFYATVKAELSVNRFDAGVAALADLRSYLGQPFIDRLPAITQRRSVDLFLIDSLENLVESERQKLSPDTRKIVESAEMISSVSARIARADGLIEDGRFDAAHAEYISALSEIPAVKQGYDALQDFAVRETAARRAVVDELIVTANEHFAGNRFAEAVATYNAAINASADGVTIPDTILENVMIAGYREMREPELERIASLSGDLETALEQLADARSEAGALSVRIETLEKAREEAELELAAFRTNESAYEREAIFRSEEIADLQTALSTSTAHADDLAEDIESLTKMLASSESEFEVATAGLTAAKELEIELAVQSEAYRETISSLEERISGLESEAFRAMSEAEQTADVLEITRIEFDEIQAELSLARVELDETNDKLDTTLSELDVVRTDLGDAMDDLEVATAELDRTTAELDKTTTEFDKTTAELDKTTTELDKTTTELDKTTTELDDANASLERTFAELDDANADLERSAAELDVAQSDLERIASELEDANTGLENVASDLALRNAEIAARDLEISRLRLIEQAEEQKRLLGVYLSVIRGRYANANSEMVAADTAAGVDPVELLETKLIITRLLSSSAIKAEYPDIVDRMNTYFVALASSERESGEKIGRIDTLTDVNAFIDAVLSDMSVFDETDSTTVPSKVENGFDTSQSEFAEFIGKLEGMIQFGNN
jgi:chromosome segregation ATPase